MRLAFRLARKQLMFGILTAIQEHAGAAITGLNYLRASVEQVRTVVSADFQIDKELQEALTAPKQLSAMPAPALVCPDCATRALSKLN